MFFYGDRRNHKAEWKGIAVRHVSGGICKENGKRRADRSSGRLSAAGEDVRHTGQIPQCTFQGQDDPEDKRESGMHSRIYAALSRKNSTAGSDRLCSL